MKKEWNMFLAGAFFVFCLVFIKEKSYVAAGIDFMLGAGNLFVGLTKEG